MRAGMKQKIQEIMQTLYDALCYLDNQKSINDSLFKDCIMCIETIKNSLADEADLFMALCEKCLDSILQRNFEKACQYLEELWLKVDTDIKGIYEIVFLPYKADMWDSFESIWKAAKNCEQCHVTVIPIPYYIRSSESNLLKTETDCFPEEVTISHYNEYNLEAMQPDVIFIHNPYDQYNRVTCVHPDYFSERLVNYTEKLVYIPYFVVAETAQTMVFPQYMMPSIQRAWRTFVQSNTVRQTYLKNTKLKPDQIVAMGSPKFDCVVTENYLQGEIPKDWKEKIAEKKVFLLNTHLDNILNAAKELPDRLRLIFSIFKENDDSVLLWRPHPLSIETIKSIVPELYPEYMKVLEEFRNLPNTIYDTSSNLHRAIAVSNAYMGDNSSLVTLYQKTCKPLMIFKAIKDKSKTNSYIYAMAGAIKDGFLYFSTWFNGMFRLNLQTEELEFLSMFLTEPNCKFTLHSFAYIYQNFCWFIPQGGEYVTKVDLDTYKMYKIEIPGMNKNLETKFFKTIARDGNLWLLPCHTDTLIKINLENDEVTRYCNWPDEIKVKENSINCFGGTFAGNSLWLNMAVANRAVKMDLSDEVMSTIPWDMQTGIMGDLCFDGTFIWSYIRNSKYIYGWSVDNQKTRKIYFDIPDSDVTDKITFHCIYSTSNAIWLFPRQSSVLLKINPETEEVQYIDLVDDNMEFVGNQKELVIRNVISEGKNLYCICALTNQIININIDTNQIKRYYLNMTDNLKDEWFECKLNNSLFLEDFLTDDNCSINYFVKNLDKLENIRTANHPCDDLNLDGTCGQKIWDYILDALNTNGEDTES